LPGYVSHKAIHQGARKRMRTHPALCATFSRKGHGCPGKVSGLIQNVAAHAPQNQGTR
jgi:hypothetical protein